MSKKWSIEVKVPATFYYDHVGRDLPAGKILKEYATKILVKLDEESYDELLSDAEFYADGAGGLGSEFRGLISSAQATVRALEAALL
jgi:hypothetical protein